MPKPLDSTILDFLKSKGPHLDFEIAEALSIPLKQVRNHVAELSSSGDLICCSTTLFKDGNSIEGLSCRVSCYIPPAARGRKPGSAQKTGNDKTLD